RHPLHLHSFPTRRSSDLFFWFYSHPAVYIMVVPAFGVVSEIFPVFCRKRIFGYKFIALSSVAIAILGFLVWGHHMFVSGQSVVRSEEHTSELQSRENLVC